MTPVPKALLAQTRTANAAGTGNKQTLAKDRADAVLLSEHFFDAGLLAIPSSDAAGLLAEEPARKLKDQHDRL